MQEIYIISVLLRCQNNCIKCQFLRKCYGFTEKIKSNFTILNIKHQYMEYQCYPDVRLHCLSTNVSCEPVRTRNAYILATV